MNRTTVKNHASLERAVVALYLKVSIGSTGAPTLVSSPPSRCLGVYSMTRTGAGAYTIKFGLNSTTLDTYQRLLYAGFVDLKSTAPAESDMYVVADNSALLTNPNIQIQFVDVAGAAVDPSSGSVLLIKIELSNTTAI